MTIPASNPSAGPGEIPAYHISLDRVTALGRSAVAVLAARRVPASPSFLKPDYELSDPEELLREIAEFGPQEQDYIRSEMPIQEIVFRTILTRGNQPIALRELHEDLVTRWSTPLRPITVTREGLARVLDQDTYYGFTSEESPDLED